MNYAESWDGDPLLTVQGFAVGSNGFGGFTAETAGLFGRENVAAYLEVDWESTDRFLLNELSSETHLTTGRAGIGLPCILPISAWLEWKSVVMAAGCELLLKIATFLPQIRSARSKSSELVTD